MPTTKTIFFAKALLAAALCALLASIPLWARAQDGKPPEKPANEQVIEPEIDRREVKLPRFPSKDIEVGTFVGTYASEDFGTHAVFGVRLGYHISEDIFVQG